MFGYVVNLLVACFPSRAVCCVGWARQLRVNLVHVRCMRQHRQGVHCDSAKHGSVRDELRCNFEELGG